MLVKNVEKKLEYVSQLITKKICFLYLFAFFFNSLSGIPFTNIDIKEKKNVKNNCFMLNMSCQTTACEKMGYFNLLIFSVIVHDIQCTLLLLFKKMFNNCFNA